MTRGFALCLFILLAGLGASAGLVSCVGIP
jgi:hypothetical protein